MKIWILSLFFLGLAFARPFNEDDYTDNDGDLPMENPDLIEGDILPDFDSDDRNAITNKNWLWEDGIVPYVISDYLKNHESAIQEAMKSIELKTCIKFRPKNKGDIAYLKIIRGKGCYSIVGKLGAGQPLSLGEGCYDRGTIVHELLHALGFHHEHKRSDRDDFIQIHWENIRKGHENNFMKLKPDQNNLINKFDYNSIMLYGEYTFSADVSKGLKTMTAKESGIRLKDTFEKPGLSKSDIERINILYNCSSKKSPNFLFL